MKLSGLLSLFRGFRFDIASASERGLVRAENQDHILVSRRARLFCVADGMGGGEGGAQASEIVCRSIADVLRTRRPLEERVGLVDGAIRRAGAEIFRIAEEAGYSQMGSTVTLFMADAAAASTVVVGNVGDSRVYRLRRRELVQLTEDHTVERDLRGRAGFRPMFDARKSPFAHVLTRAVGVGRDVRVDWSRADLRAGDVFLVCSDGVHGAVSPSALKNALADGGRARETLERLRAAVLAGGAPDNFSAIVVKVGGRR